MLNMSVKNCRYLTLSSTRKMCSFSLLLYLCHWHLLLFLISSDCSINNTCKEGSIMSFLRKFYVNFFEGSLAWPHWHSNNRNCKHSSEICNYLDIIVFLSFFFLSLQRTFSYTCKKMHLQMYVNLPWSQLPFSCFNYSIYFIL